MTVNSNVNGREPIGVIGTGYVGLVTAAGFAELGNEVWCIDIDAAKIKRLEDGEIPIYEPGLAELVAKHRSRLHFSTDIADALEHARLLFVAVGTPPTYSGDVDLSAVHAVVYAIPPSDTLALVMKSTVPVGTGTSIKRIFGEQGNRRAGSLVHAGADHKELALGPALDSPTGTGASLRLPRPWDSELSSRFGGATLPLHGRC